MVSRMIRIENLLRSPFSFNLYHQEVCVLSGTCSCTPVEVHRKGGERGTRLDARGVRIGGFGSVEGNVSEPLPEAVAQLGPVATRIREGTVRILTGQGYAPMEVVKPSPEDTSGGEW